MSAMEYIGNREQGTGSGMRIARATARDASLLFLFPISHSPFPAPQGAQA